MSKTFLSAYHRVLRAFKKEPLIHLLLPPPPPLPLPPSPPQTPSSFANSIVCRVLHECSLTSRQKVYQRRFSFLFWCTSRTESPLHKTHKQRQTHTHTHAHTHAHTHTHARTHTQTWAHVSGTEEEHFVDVRIVCMMTKYCQYYLCSIVSTICVRLCFFFSSFSSSPPRKNVFFSCDDLGRDARDHIHIQRKKKKERITFFLVDGLGSDARDHILVQVLNISHVLHALTV